MKRFNGSHSASYLAFAAATLLTVFASGEANAQTSQEDTTDTAKPADTVSPYGVSYTTGSFTYSVPLFTIGNGDFPNSITVSLNYDSSGARAPNRAWTFSTSLRASGQFASYVTGFEGDPLWEYHQYSANFVAGNTSQSFYLAFAPIGAGTYGAMFEAASANGSSISFVETVPGDVGEPGNGQVGVYTVTGSDGATISATGEIDQDGLTFSGPINAVLPNGNTLMAFQPLNPNFVSPEIETGNGLYIHLDGNSVCAFNLAFIEKSQITSCSQSDLVASFTTLSPPNNQHNHITSITRPDGGTYTFEYDAYTGGSALFGGTLYPPRTRHHLSCVKEPGQSACVVDNTYDPCDGFGYDGPSTPDDIEWSGSRDRVIRQDLPDGRVITYTYNPPPAGQPCRVVSNVDMAESGAVTSLTTVAQPGANNDSRQISTVVDPLLRTTEYTWTGALASYVGQNDKLASLIAPEDNSVEYSYDSRGNRTETRIKAKPGSGLADVVTTATYPATCTQPKTCNKPTSVTDAEGNTTTFTYDAAHGGVLTEQGPSVGGVSPATKHYYVQREAWLKSGSGYAKSGVPIWLLSETRSCRTTSLNLSNGTCAGGASDLVRMTFDYGPDSGPNNLWLRGTAAIADGQTLRTCFSYDELGRRVSETQPKAGLTSCP